MARKVAAMLNADAMARFYLTLVVIALLVFAFGFVMGFIVGRQRREVARLKAEKGK